MESSYKVDAYWAFKYLNYTVSRGSQIQNANATCDDLLGTYSWKSYVERGFSLNKRLVTADHACLGEETVNAVRLIKNVMRTRVRCWKKLNMLHKMQEVDSQKL